MSRKPRNAPGLPDTVVDQAVADVNAAIDRLVGLLYTNDLERGGKVGMALIAIGEFAAGRLVKAAMRSPEVGYRLALLFVLKEIYRGSDPAVGEALLQIAKNDPDDRVGHLAAAVLGTLAERDFITRVREQAGKESQSTKIPSRPADPAPRPESCPAGRPGCPGD
jgi:hypothetical protein